MKTDSAAIGVKNGHGKKVIDVNRHAADHAPKSEARIGRKQVFGRKRRENKVQEIVN